MKIEVIRLENWAIYISEDIQKEYRVCPVIKNNYALWSTFLIRNDNIIDKTIVKKILEKFKTYKMNERCQDRYYLKVRFREKQEAIDFIEEVDSLLLINKLKGGK